PDHVLAAGVGLPVEPAVAGLDREPGLLEETLPLGLGDPGEAHSRAGIGVADREGQSPRLGVPVGTLEEPRLALEPAPVGLGDVVCARGEDVEDEPPTRDEHAARRPKRLEPLRVGPEMEVRPKRACDKADAFAYRWR